jgi:hypothetical protein
LIALAQILEARGKLSHDLRYQTKLQSSNEDTVPVPFSNVDGALASPAEVLVALKGQDGSVMATSFSNIDYGVPQPTNQEFLSTNAISDAGTVSSDNISSSVPVQLVPVLKDATVESRSMVEESTRDLSTGDAATEEQSMQMSEIALVDNSLPKDDRHKQPLADISEQSVDIQKTYHDEDDDGDEWLEEETGGPGNTTIPIADDEDVSFSDLEDDDGTT